MAKTKDRDPLSDAVAKAFAARLKQAREARGLTQVGLAALLDRSQPELASYERGDRVVQLDTACRVADVLHVSLDWLAGRTEEGGPLDPQPKRRRAM